MLKKELLFIIIILVIIILIFIILFGKKQISSDYNFKVYFFNAGKADAILISKNNKYILIDTGKENLSSNILNYFEKNNIKKLEYLIITHFDKDHVGSASTIIDKIEIGEVLQSNSPKDSEYYNKYLNSLSDRSITPTTVKGNYELSFEDVKILVNGPEITYEKNTSNNSSLIVSITNDNNKFLFMGDAENKRIKDYISVNKETYDFIKIPYHGNYLKRLDDLLDVVKPKYGVITCSSSEGCEDDTIKLLDDYNIKYYMSKNGDITVFSNGKDILIKQ